MLLNLVVLRTRQPGCLVEELAADLELADVVQETGRAHVFNPIGAELEVHRNSGRVLGDPVGMMFRVLVFGNEVPQDQQYAVIRLAQLAQLVVLVLVERAHEIGGHNEAAAPGHEVEPY